MSLKPNECYYIYRPDGFILYTIEHPAPETTEQTLLSHNHTFVIGPKLQLDTIYVDTVKKKVKTRVELSAAWNGSNTVAADGSSLISFTAPAGTQVFIEGDEAGVVDANGIFEIAAEIPGEYDIRLDLWPYLSKNLIFTAV